MPSVRNGAAREAQASSEPLSGHSHPVIDRARCVYCRRCAEACQAGAPYRDGDAYAINYSKCTACGTCLGVCRTEAISLAVNQKTASGSRSSL